MNTRGAVLLWMAVGCAGGDSSEGDDPDFPRACDQAAIDGDCVDYTGSGWTAEDVAGSCEGGTLLPECPPNSIVGYCTVEGGGEFETVTAFYVPFWTAPTGAQACQGQGGSWEVAD